MRASGLDEALAALLREVGRAHHEAFAHVGGDDPDWAGWYAERLAPRLAIIGRPALEAATVAAALAGAEQSRKQDAPDAEWSSYYVTWMLARAPWRVRPT